MKQIPLLGGHVAIVDDDDYESVSVFSWCVAIDERRSYAQRYNGTGRHDRTTISMHVQLLGRRAGLVTDHINGNGLDNRRANLRWVTTAENAWNARLSRRNKSGVKGLTRTKFGYWCAEIMAHGIRHRTVRARREDAEDWLRSKRIELHGQFARYE